MDTAIVSPELEKKVRQRKEEIASGNYPLKGIVTSAMNPFGPTAEPIKYKSEVVKDYNRPSNPNTSMLAPTSAIPKQQPAIQQPTQQPVQQPVQSPTSQAVTPYQPQMPAYRSQPHQPTQYNAPEYGSFAQPGTAYHTRVRDVSAPSTYEVDKLISNAIRQHGSAQTMNGKRAAEGLLDKLLAYRQQVLSSANPQYDLAKQQLANQGHEHGQMLANQGAVQTGMIGAIGGERTQAMRNQGEENTQALRNKGYFDAQAMKVAGDIEQARGQQSTALEVAKIAHAPDAVEALQRKVFAGQASPLEQDMFSKVLWAKHNNYDFDAVAKEGQQTIAELVTAGQLRPEAAQDALATYMNNSLKAAQGAQSIHYAEGGMIGDNEKPPGQPAIPMAQQLSQPPQQPQPMNLASGGAINVAGRKLAGPGTETSDSIPAVIDGKKKAALSTGEYVIPAHIVKLLGTKFFDNLIKKNTVDEPEEEDSEEEESDEEEGYAMGGGVGSIYGGNTSDVWGKPGGATFPNTAYAQGGVRDSATPSAPSISPRVVNNFQAPNYAYGDAGAYSPPEQVPGFSKALPGAVISRALPGANKYTSPNNPYLHYEDTGNTGSFAGLYKQHQAIAPDRTDYVSPNSGFSKGPIRPKPN